LEDLSPGVTATRRGRWGRRLGFFQPTTATTSGGLQVLDLCLQQRDLLLESLVLPPEVGRRGSFVFGGVFVRDPALGT